MATSRYLKNYVTFYPAPMIRKSKFELDFDYLNSEKGMSECSKSVIALIIPKITALKAL